MIRLHHLVLLLIAIAILTACHREVPRVAQPAYGRIIHIDNFPSTYVDSVQVDIWLPDGYDNTKPYAVLYMQDGQALFDPSFQWNNYEFGVDETISALMLSNEIHPTIVVGIWNMTYKRCAQYFPQKPYESLPAPMVDSLNVTFTQQLADSVFSDAYLKFIVRDLKPFVDDEYSTLTDKANTFVAGSSMGGLISMYAICEYPEIFGGAACLSTHWVGTLTSENTEFTDAYVRYMAQEMPSPKDHKLYFDYGTVGLDSLYEHSQMRVDSLLNASGYDSRNWVTQKFEGHDHHERSWRERLHIPLKFLLGK